MVNCKFCDARYACISNYLGHLIRNHLRILWHCSGCLYPGNNSGEIKIHIGQCSDCALERPIAEFQENSHGWHTVCLLASLKVNICTHVE